MKTKFVVVAFSGEKAVWMKDKIGFVKRRNRRDEFSDEVVDDKLEKNKQGEDFKHHKPLKPAENKS